jgi:hypothetical protein
MFSIRKNPFAERDDALESMMALLSAEAEKAGTPFTAGEEKILRSERASGQSVPADLREKSRKIIERLLGEERAKSQTRTLKSFSASLEWAGDRAYPNAVALTEEVIMSGGFGALPLHGKRLVWDRMSLLGCAFLVVLFIAFVIFVAGELSTLFHWR